MLRVQRSIRQEWRPADAPPVGRLDVMAVGLFVAAVLVEGLVRPDLTWRPLVTVFALGLAPALLWRRDRPLVAVLVGWGITGLLSVLQLTTDTPSLGLDSMTAVLILLYALVRWGSGREIGGGAAFVTLVVVLGMYASSASGADVFGGSVLLLLVVALGAVFRYRAELSDRQLREVRNQERMALARELHDTVAHHVSAIAVQAQAGGVVAGLQPERVAEVLAAIESEASRTLVEMRSVVRVLRDDAGPDHSPQPGVADLPSLARAATTPTVDVAVGEALTRLPQPLGTAVYRLAQESMTNALRHARGATRIGIEVRRERDAVRLRVVDDGRTAPGPAPEHGFGILGMVERAQLLGGSLTAGPRPEGGWVVEAVLPVEAST